MLFKGVNVPFFYVKNNNFCALFMRESNGKPVVILNPNKSIAAIVNECNHHLLTHIESI